MFRTILLVCFLWGFGSFAAQAAGVLSLNLDKIVAGAAIAFQGRCTANRVELDTQTGFVVTYTSFEVSDVLKGIVSATHTIKQIGGRADGKHFRVDGVPRFAVGQDYVVFLYGVSSAGFSSPVGLSQGQFMVRQEAGGARVSNGRDFDEMLQSTPTRGVANTLAVRPSRESGQNSHMGLDEFKKLVRQQGATK